MNHLLLIPLLLLLLLPPAPLQAEESKLEIIPLHHRNAGEILSSLRPFVAQGGVIKAHGNQLIIKTSAKNLAELKQIIATLDQAARQLIITVRQTRAGEGYTEALGAEGEITTGGGAAVTIEGHRTGRRDQAVAEQQIRTLEGQAATIQIGQSIPVGELSTQQTPWGSQSQGGVKYKSVTSGFTVIPRLQGNEVVLEIASQSQAPATSGGGIINTQKTQTTLRAKLGQWVKLGGVAGEEASSDQAIIHHTARRDERQRQIYIRVTEVR